MDDLEQLKAALRPFADIGRRISPSCADANLVDVTVDGSWGDHLLDAGDFKRAYRVMQELDPINFPQRAY